MALKRISGLWLKDGRGGKFLSGNVTAGIPAGAKLLVFKNQHKRGENDPDYTLNLAIDDEPQSPTRDEHAGTEPNPFRERAGQGSNGGKHGAPIGDSTKDVADGMRDFEDERRRVVSSTDEPIPF